MNRKALAAFVCLLGLGATALPAVAQDLTEEEIVNRFEKQKTRGLKISEVSQGGAAGAATVEPVAATPTTILPEDEQVNLNISFDFDSAALRADQKPRLDAMCSAMQALDGESFRILGHTDASGSDSYNQRLSQLRAEEVKRYLVSECGIPAALLEATGVGEEAPLDPSDPRADINRRVEFQLVS